MPKSVPLRAIAETRVDPGTPWAASAIALPAAISGFKTDSALSPRKVEGAGGRRPIGRDAGDPRRQQAGEQERPRLVAVVALVAHVERLGGERAQVDRLASASAAEIRRRARR
jgi:hypothetical protein